MTAADVVVCVWFAVGAVLGVWWLSWWYKDNRRLRRELTAHDTPTHTEVRKP